MSEDQHDGLDGFVDGMSAGAWMFTIMLTFISFWLVRRMLRPVEG